MTKDPNATSALPKLSRAQANAICARLIDEMLAAQTRFAAAWQDGQPLTAQQQRDERKRDTARAKLMELLT